jgi:hypothetical protein
LIHACGDRQPPYAALIGNVPKSVKESELCLKIQDTCGRTNFEYLIEYTPKQPCYADLAGTNDTLTNMWFVVEFDNPNALKACVDLNGTSYKESKLRVRGLSHKEYDMYCGLLDIMKSRTKRIKKTMKGLRLTLVLASNVSSRVSSDALYKFFSFPGDPIEITIDRSRKLAMIAYNSEEQGVVACACDQAVLGPAMVRIELYRPDKHGKDLQQLLKVAQTGDILHTGAQTGYVQVSERNTDHVPPSPLQAQKPQLYDPSMSLQLPPTAVQNPYSNASAAKGSGRPVSMYPALGSSAIGSSQAAPTLPPSSHATKPYIAPSISHMSPSHTAPKPYGGSSPISPSSHAAPTAGYGYASQPYKQPTSASGQSQPLSQSHANPYQGQQSHYTPVAPQNFDKLAPSAKYQVTTEYK